MYRDVEKQHAKRAHSLGESGDPQAVPELLEFIRSPSAEVRRMAVSAIGKLGGLADPELVIVPLKSMLTDRHPQVRQYTIKALSAYGSAAKPVLADL